MKTQNKIFALLLALVICLSTICLSACDGNVEFDAAEDRKPQEITGRNKEEQTTTEPSKELEFTLSTDKEYYTVSGIGGYEHDTEVIIPAEYNFLPVKEIGDGAFYNCTNLISVIVPSSITSIGKRAFANCSNLTNIIIPQGITSINIGTFAYCNNLQNVIIPDSVKNISQSAFAYCSSLASVTIPSGVTKIDDSAFNACTKLKNITFNGSKSEWLTLNQQTLPNGCQVKCTDITVALDTDTGKWGAIIRPTN